MRDKLIKNDKIILILNWKYKDLCTLKYCKWCKGEKEDWTYHYICKKCNYALQYKSASTPVNHWSKKGSHKSIYNQYKLRTCINMIYT